MSDLIEALKDAARYYDNEGRPEDTVMWMGADEIERLRAALQKIANHNDGELLTREADDMANIARAALDTVDEKERT